MGRQRKEFLTNDQLLLDIDAMVNASGSTDGYITWEKINEKEKYKVKQKQDAISETIKEDSTVIDARINEILQELSIVVCNEENVYQYIERLRECYRHNYRHSYYNISTILYETQNKPDDLQRLSENMYEIYILIEAAGENGEFPKKIRKLYDHVMLENVRISQTNEVLERIERERNLK